MTVATANSPKLIDLPKKGFAIPLADWLRGDLRDWAGSLIENGDYSRVGLKKDDFYGMWIHHINGSKDFSGQLWALIMLFSWLAVYSPYLKEQT